MADLKIYSQLAHLKNIDEFKKLETLSLFRYEGEALNVVNRAVGSSFMMGRWGGGWVKMLATMVGQRRKIKRKHWLKYAKAVLKKWFKISYLKFFCWKFYFWHTTFLYSSTCSSGHHQSFFFDFSFSRRKSQSQ